MNQQKLVQDIYNMTEHIDKYAAVPGKVALLWENEDGETKQLTYRKLLQDSNKFANALKGMGLQKGDIVITLLPRIPETYSIFLGALKLGLIISPGSEMLMEKDLLYRANHSHAKATICLDELTARIDQIRSEAESLKYFIAVGKEVAHWENYQLLIEAESDQFETIKTRSDDIAFLNYTSGTTGNPKAVIHNHSWAIAHMESTNLWLGIEENNVVWATAAPGWAKWNWTPFISTLGNGATGLVYRGKFNPEKYLSLMEKYKVNVLCCTPTEYRLMAKLDGLEQFRLPHLRHTVSAGEPLNQEVIEKFNRFFNVQVRDGYGQSENTLLVGNLIGMKLKPGSMGKPTPGNKVAIINEQGEHVSVGQIGDIAVHRSSPSLFKGYLNDSERTAAAFRGDWYLTGDQARLDEDGYFWFEGRSDDIIISSGYTIGPFEVEDALIKHPSVKECAVVAKPDEIRGSIVKAFVTLKDPARGNGELIKELQDHVKNITAPYKYPREIEFVDELPKTTSGKIRRVELRQAERGYRS